MMQSSDPAYNTDWVFSWNSNVHVANHRGWFTSYTAFPTTLGAGVAFAPSGNGSGTGPKVHGIGDVELPTVTHRPDTDKDHHATVILRNVLYAPKCVCNIIGSPILKDYDVGGPFSYTKIANRSDGKVVGFFDLAKLMRLRLRGQTATQSSLDPNEMYYIDATWADSERSRWEAYPARLNQQLSNRPLTPSDSSPPLTKDEKDWLKKHYRGEFHFLLQHGLSIYKEEDREEGREFHRQLMTDE